MHHLQVLKDKLREIPKHENVIIDLQGGGSFCVEPIFCNNCLCGINVDNLGNQPFLPIDVFVATISLLSLSSGYKALKGSTQERGVRLGSVQLPFDSVEGHVAKVVYGKMLGDGVFRRIVPISRVLEWAGVCINGRGFLELL